MRVISVWFLSTLPSFSSLTKKDLAKTNEDGKQKWDYKRTTPSQPFKRRGAENIPHLEMASASEGKGSKFFFSFSVL